MKGTLTTLIQGAALAEYGLTGLQHDDGLGVVHSEVGMPASPLKTQDMSLVGKSVR